MVGGTPGHAPNRTDVPCDWIARETDACHPSNEGYAQLLGTAASIKASAGTGELDLGYTIGSLGMTTPTRAPATNASNISVAEQYEVQRLLLTTAV